MEARRSSHGFAAPSGKRALPEEDIHSMRRTAIWIAITVFVIMCGMIAWSQWYAIHVNVPKYTTH